jgi:hypothetical protein
MKLAQFMSEHGYTDASMAEKIGNCSEFAVRKWKYGERTPRPRIIDRIQHISEGKVGLKDWLPAPSEEDAA